MKKKILSGYDILIGWMLGVVILILLLLYGCTTTEYVSVPQQHTEHHWHTDSVHTTDSVIKETQITIMQLDSADMARYGIQLKAAERAWLVRTAELERQIQQMMQMSATRDTVRDTVTVVKEVEAKPAANADGNVDKLTWWQKTRINIANIILYVLAIVAVYYIGKSHLKRLLP